MNQDFYIQLIYKELQERLSPQEQGQLEQWLAQSEENRKTRESIQVAWTLMDDFEPNFEIDVEADYKQVQERIKTKPTPLRSISSRRKWLGIAASIALIIGAGFLFRYLGDPPVEIMTLQTQAGEIKELVLTDGSKVWLNENSQLLYPKQFSRQERLVELKGEAFFEVSKNPAKTFQITTAQTTVTVLGTSFNVKAYPAGEKTSVAVESGKVRFAKKGSKNSLVLRKTEIGIFNHSDAKLEKKSTTTKNASAWKTNKLSFKGMALGEAFKIIEDHFKISIDCQNPVIKNCLFSMPEQEIVLSSFFENLKTIYQIQVKETGAKRFLITGGRCE